MKKKLSILFVLFAALLLTLSNARAQSLKRAPASGILYEISGKDLTKPSYLFGTIHLICEKDMFPKDKLNGYIDQTKQVMLEIDMDDQAEMLKAVSGLMLADGKTMKDHLKPEEYAKIDELFKNYLGISFDLLQKFKPLAAEVYLLSSPKVIGCQAPVVYDNFLSQTAVAKKMPVMGLEKVETQLAVINSYSLERQIKSLNETAADPEKTFAEFKTLYQLYLTQNSDDIYSLVVKEMKADGYSLEKFIDERNKNWIPVIEKNIALTPSFIAVGGGHLGGENGVVNLLRLRGYKLTPIKL